MGIQQGNILNFPFQREQNILFYFFIFKYNYGFTAIV
jgi:hypothetical protein